MVARSEFLDRINYWHSCAQEELLITKTPAEIEHNEKARLLRNGLSVAGFAILEDFAKSRLAEAISAVNGNSVRFEDLPDRLRRSALEGVLAGAAAQVRIRSWTDIGREAFIREVARSLHSTGQAAFELSPLMFGGQRSNLTVDDFSAILKTLSIDGGWQALTSFSSRAGIGVPALEASFREAAQARHSAAHDAGTDIPLTSMNGFRLTAIATALSFDALVSRATRLLGEGDSGLLGGGRVKQEDIGIRFLKESGSSWREMREGAAQAYRVHSDQATGLAGTLVRARGERQFVVITDEQGLPIDWRTTESV